MATWNEVEESLNTVFWDTHAHIVEQGLEAYIGGRDYEAIVDTLCDKFKMEPYLVYEHLNERVKVELIKKG